MRGVEDLFHLMHPSLEELSRERSPSLGKVVRFDSGIFLLSASSIGSCLLHLEQHEDIGMWNHECMIEEIRRIYK